MNQIKIGKFIAERRKLVNLTQFQLAEKLGVTDRAVSKWETGRALPDSSIMLDLCSLLKISVNDLLTGEVVSMENYNKELEKNLIEAVKQKQEADKRLLFMEFAIGIPAILLFLGLIMVAAYVPMKTWLRVVIMVSAFAMFLTACFFAVRIEQVAGYYECKHCKHKYVPTYKQVVSAMHYGRTRYMKCPKCKKFSYQKKVINN